MFTKRNDDELITAYLDGQLGDRARGEFEARMRAEASLRQQVETTRRIVQAAQRLPMVSAPRSFTLARSMQNTQQAAPLRTMMWRFASVAATAIFVIMLGLDTSGVLRPALPTPAPALMSAPANELPAAGAPAAQDASATAAQPTLEAAPDASAVPPAPGISAKRMTSDTSTLETAPLAAEANVSSTEPMTMTALMAPLPEVTSEVTTTPVPTAQPAVDTQTSESAPAPTVPDATLIARVIAGIALLVALAAGVLGWLRR